MVAGQETCKGAGGADIIFAMNEGMWMAESHTEDLGFLYRIKRVIFSGQTKFQRVVLVELGVLGKTLFLDGKLQSAQVDEALYHELLVHPAMLTHPEPKRVLIAGGGEGATLREVLRHPTVEEAVMVDIDGELVELAKEHLPEWHRGAFSDPRSRVLIGDARRYIEGTQKQFDVVISDLPEPVPGSPAIPLYSVEFYRRVSEIMGDEGVFVAQAGGADPVSIEFLASLYTTLSKVFPVVRPYIYFVFSFQLPWAWVLATKGLDPAQLDLGGRLRDRGIETEEITPEILKAVFAMPGYVKRGLSKGRVITDAQPFEWTA